MPIKDKILCFESSLNANEEMYGTATRADVWFLIEYRGHWSKSAYKDSKIPKKEKSHLNRELKSVSNSRLQLIKKQINPDSYLKLYIAVSKEENPRLYEIQFDEYKDLLDLNVKKILKSDRHITDKKIYIICTNGEYDICCGKFGMPVYLDIAKGNYEPQTWESNHIGGHRFASTFVCLPHGLVYGRVREGKAAEKLMKLYEAGKLDISSYRGRSCYTSEVQAAEYHLRKETKNSDISDFVYKSSKINDKKYNVKFLLPSDETVHKIKLRQDKKAFKIMKSCGDKNSYIPQFRLLEYQKPTSN